MLPPIGERENNNLGVSQMPSEFSKISPNMHINNNDFFHTQLSEF